jgi:hypothetical protein
MEIKMDKTVTISIEAAEIIDRWFLPANPAKLRRGPSADQRNEARAAVLELRAAVKAALRKEG